MSLHSKAIDKLKELGVSKDLWLVELSTIDTAKEFYPARLIDDLTQFAADDHDSIIYYHESGSICKHKTFNSDDPDDFIAAVKEMAVYLGAEVLQCPECSSTKINEGEIVEGNHSESYNICDKCGHRWNNNSILI